MARVSQSVNYYNFSGGKVSDTNPLTPPENAVRKLLNVDLHKDGSLARRPGLEPEYNFSTQGPYSLQDLVDAGVDVHIWNGVDFNPELNYVVVRIGNTLSIYKPTVYTISTGLIKTIDISEFRTPEAQADVARSFQAVSGKGLLVCSGGYYRPFYVQYKEQENTWVTAGIDIRVRDFEGVDDGYRLDYRLTIAENNSNGGKRLYNLYNQGWAKNEIESFVNNMNKRGGGARIPANTDIASLGRMIDSDKRVYEFARTSFQAHPIVLRPTSTGRAPMGHFIIDPFDTNTRATEAARQNGGVFNVGGEITNKRPKAVAFYAGRFFYGSVNGVIYYSKIVEGVSDLGKCYQENDPTTEDMNQLLDTDGGTIKIMGVGTVERLVPMGNSLVAIGTNGIYVISGGADKGFTANSQQVGFLSNVVCLSYRSVVSTNGPVLFWSDRGIFAISSDELGTPKIQSISDYKIGKDYNNIPMAARMVAQGCFDPVENKVLWFYSRHTDTLTDTVVNRYTDVLVFDMTTGAFWDYSIADGGFSSVTDRYPMMVCGLPTSSRVSTSFNEDVVDNNGDPVTSAAGDVYIERSQYGISNTTLSVGVMLPTEDDTYNFTFAKFTNRFFVDWDKVAGVEAADFVSEVETLPNTLGEPSVKKQTPYVYTYYTAEREYPVRDDPGSGGGGGPVDPDPVDPDPVDPEDPEDPEEPSLWPPPFLSNIPEGVDPSGLYYDITGDLYWEKAADLNAYGEGSVTYNYGAYGDNHTLTTEALTPGKLFEIVYEGGGWVYRPTEFLLSKRKMVFDTLNDSPYAPPYVGRAGYTCTWGPETIEETPPEIEPPYQGANMYSHYVTPRWLPNRTGSEPGSILRGAGIRTVPGWWNTPAASQYWGRDILVRLELVDPFPPTPTRYGLPGSPASGTGHREAGSGSVRNSLLLSTNVEYGSFEDVPGSLYEQSVLKGAEGGVRRSVGSLQCNADNDWERPPSAGGGRSVVLRFKMGTLTGQSFIERAARANMALTFNVEGMGPDSEAPLGTQHVSIGGDISGSNMANAPTFKITHILIDLSP